MKFLKKHLMVIVIAILVVLFVILAVLSKGNEQEKEDLTVSTWLTDTKEGYVVSVYAQTTCIHCKNFKPIMNEVKEDHNFKLYWFELDTLNESDLNTVLNTYEMTGYRGTPYTLVTKDGKVVTYKSGEMTKDALVEFLTSANVIQ